MNNKLLNVQESAAFLGLSISTIRRWAQEGELKGVKVGSRGDWRFTKEELTKMIRLEKHKFTQIRQFLREYASQIQKISTQKHETLIGNGQHQGLSKHRKEHIQIIKKLADNLGNFEKGKEVFLKLGEKLARQSIKENLSLEEGIDGLIFLRQSIWEKLYQEGLLQKLTPEDFYTLSHIFSTYTDILTSKLAFSYESIIEDKLESEKKYQLVVENVTDVINLIDLQGNILYVSPSGQKISGFSPKETQAKNAFSFVHPEDLEKIKQRFQEVAQGKKTPSLEYRIKHKKGYWVMMEGKGAVILDNKGKPKYLVTTSREITEQHVIREKLKEQAELLQLTSDAFLIQDRDNQIISWNKGAEKLYGYTEKEALGKKGYELLKTKFSSPMEEIYKLIKTKGSWNGELTHTTKSGNTVVVDSMWKVMPNSNNSLFLEVNRNITERKKLEQRKDDFVALASHELKTPITSMKMFTQVLQQNFQNTGDETSAKFLINMDKQLNKLTEIVNGLLDVTRVQQGKLTYKKEVFAIDSLVKEVVENVQRTTTKHTITLDGQTKKSVIGDRDRIGQVLVNLLTNAIKYSPKATKIIVSSKNKNSHVLISVQDFGVGIPNDQLDKIFDRFFQVNSPTVKTFPGLGLGLYITKEIVQRHQGKIWVESKEGKGSIFYFSLPTIHNKVVNQT